MLVGVPDNRDEFVSKEAPQGLLEKLAAPHEVPEEDDVTGSHPLMAEGELEELERKSIRKRLKRLSVVEAKVDEVSTELAHTQGRLETILTVNEKQSLELEKTREFLEKQSLSMAEIAKMRVQVNVDADQAAIAVGKARALTQQELTAVAIKSRWAIAELVAKGLFGAGGIAAIIALALTKGC